eukprot:GHVH01000422.1.p1 GENE.GHVH01000422.1~~GHVH01000422.1.p1  ORF type:complete len:435 (+),score=52.54 GHVH01000422.1:637-1941(+)
MSMHCQLLKFVRSMKISMHLASGLMRRLLRFDVSPMTGTKVFLDLWLFNTITKCSMKISKDEVLKIVCGTSSSFPLFIFSLLQLHGDEEVWKNHEGFDRIDLLKSEVDKFPLLTNSVNLLLYLKDSCSGVEYFGRDQQKHNNVNGRFNTEISIMGVLEGMGSLSVSSKFILDLYRNINEFPSKESLQVNTCLSKLSSIDTEYEDPEERWFNIFVEIMGDPEKDPCGAILFRRIGYQRSSDVIQSFFNRYGPIRDAKDCPQSDGVERHLMSSGLMFRTNPILIRQLMIFATWVERAFQNFKPLEEALCNLLVEFECHCNSNFKTPTKFDSTWFCPVWTWVEIYLQVCETPSEDVVQMISRAVDALAVKVETLQLNSQSGIVVALALVLNWGGAVLRVGDKERQESLRGLIAAIGEVQTSTAMIDVKSFLTKSLQI